MNDQLSKWNGVVQATPYPTQRISPLISAPENESRRMIQSVASGAELKLNLLNEEIIHLQKKMQSIIDSTRKDIELHLIPCSVAKRPGGVFHLFEREDGSRFFSIISPSEWGAFFNLKHLGSFLLNADNSWSEVV